MTESIEKSDRRSCDLHSVQDVRDWLAQPENQVRSALYIIKWDGATPYISVAPVDRRVDLECNDALATCVLLEHRRRKFRPKTEDMEEPDGTVRTLQE